MDWIDLGNGRHVLRGAAPAYQPKRRRDPSAVELEHISSGLPRWCKFHKGEFTKDGKPIVRGHRDIDHITKASHGRYQFDYRNDRARPFQSGDQYRHGGGRV